MDGQTKNIRELIEGFSQDDFEKDVNLHIHSSFSDGKFSPQELVAKAKEKNYRFIAICDHNTVDAYKKTDILQSGFVIPAVEFDCWYRGILVHLLGYGIDVHNEELLKHCAKTKQETEADIVRFLNRRHPRQIIDAIHKAGGIAVLAHPACYWAINLKHFVKSLIDLGLDGLEVYYPYRRHRGIIKFHKSSAVKRIAQSYGLIMTGGSDSHAEIESIV